MLINDDFSQSVSVTDFAMQRIFPLELTTTRFTALMKLPKHASLDSTQLVSDITEPLELDKGFLTSKWHGLELFILEGHCEWNTEQLSGGGYLRIPPGTDYKISAITDGILLVRYNQFLTDDDGLRNIDTKIRDAWLPGPVDGTLIRPLHVFDTESIMLLWWKHAAEFRPNINPRGEEILVLNGLLQNREHLYRQFSWVRHPIEEWRKWHGNTGTLIYYKSGHFPVDP